MKQKKQLFLPVLLPKIGLALLDALIVNIAVVFSYLLLNNFVLNTALLTNFFQSFWVLSIFTILSLCAYRVYHVLWIYASSLDIARIAMADQDVVGIDGGSQASFLRVLWIMQDLPSDIAHCCLLYTSITDCSATGNVILTGA